MANPNYVLTFADRRGNAELIRMLFKEADVAFVDVRLTEEEFKEQCPENSSGFNPRLTINGETDINEILSIAKYIARTHFVGPNANDNRCDAHVCVFYCTFAYAMHMASYEAEFSDERRKFFQNWVYFNAAGYIRNLENCLVANDSGYLVGEQLTWADVFIGCGLNEASIFTESAWDIFHGNEQVKLFVERIVSRPNIANWLRDRP